MNQRLLSF